MYRNVRNFNNLYENRQLASKNTELQDQLRLGAQRLWTVKKNDIFNALPNQAAIASSASRGQSHGQF